MRRPGGPWTDRGHRLSAETTTEVAHWVKGIKGRRSIEVVLDDEERSILERNVQNPDASGTFAVRCKAILYCADGLSNREVGRELGLCNATVAAWRRRFLKDRIEGLSDKRKGRRECPPVNGRKVEEIARGEVDLGRRLPPLRLDEDERLSLEMLVRSRCGTGAISDRCRIILRCADGLTNKAIAAELDMTPSALGKWRKRFFKFGVEGLLGRPRMDLGGPCDGWKGGRGHRLVAQHEAGRRSPLDGARNGRKDRTAEGNDPALVGGSWRAPAPLEDARTLHKSPVRGKGARHSRVLLSAPC